MDHRIRNLLDQIAALEGELRSVVHEQEAQLRYRLDGKRVRFEDHVRQTHRQLKRSILRWIVTDRPQNFITGPVIYALALPLVFLDLWVTLFQATCFPIYRIEKVRRGDYIVYDRHHLEFLNWFERFHCTYCEYANGLLAYAGEIAARTEQYFCPIKHAQKVLGSHARGARFLAYGEAADYHGKLEEYRLALEEKTGD
jgi:hypothetical protein